MSSKQTKNFSQKRNKSKQDLFRLCFMNQNKQKILVCFGLFRFFKPISKQLKQTELFRNKPNNPKFSEKIPKYALYQTVSVALLCVSVQSKHQNSLFQYRRLEAKQPKQTFCFGQCQNQFRFKFWLFRIKTSFEGHPISERRVIEIL